MNVKKYLLLNLLYNLANSVVNNPDIEQSRKHLKRYRRLVTLYNHYWHPEHKIHRFGSLDKLEFVFKKREWLRNQ